MFELGNCTESVEERRVTANDVKAYAKAMAEINRLKKFTDALKDDIIHDVKLFGEVDKKNPNKKSLAVGKTIASITWIENVRFNESKYREENPDEYESYKEANPYFRVNTNV